ncbi:MAG: hypothetical protein H0U76_20450 [Ktedonobacteraceae bacterium]|nr:hypothetical protein [Ktedonobacteraceae bacterium]
MYNVSDNCDQFDPKTGYCVHWRTDLSTSPVYDSAYNSGRGHSANYYYSNNNHDADYYYKYYCDRYDCNCS